MSTLIAYIVIYGGLLVAYISAIGYLARKAAKEAGATPPKATPPNAEIGSAYAAIVAAE